MKSNRLASILSLILALLLLGSCANSGENKKNYDTPSKSDVTTLQDDNSDSVKTPKFYYLGTEASSVFQSNENFAKASDYMFGGKTATNVIETKKNTTKNILDRGTFTYLESKVIFTDIKSGKVASIYGVHDTYVSADGKTEVTFLEGTDTITFYEEKKDETLTEKIDIRKAKEISDAFLAKILPGYSLEDMHTTMDEDVSGTQKSFWFGYAKKINGLISDEDILVWVSEYGQIRGYNGENVRKYDKLASSITSEKISKAVGEFNEAIKDIESLASCPTENYICTDNDGKIYVSVAVVMSETHRELFYIPI